MDIKQLWQKLDQIAEATDLKSIPEAKKKKPDADGDGVPDWADKKPGKDDNEDKKEVKEDADPETKAAHSKGAADAARGITKNPYNPGSPLAAAYEEGQQSYKRNFGEGLDEGEMSSRKGDNGETIRVHKAKAGGYGRKIDKDDESGDKFHSSDIDDTDDEPVSAVKRGRGRPRIGADSDTGEVKKYDTDTLASWIIGNKPKNIKNIGKTSHVNRLKEYMEQVETKILVEGMMSELDIIRQDIESGDLDVYDIIVGKFVPHGKAEEYAVKMIKDAFEEMTRFTGDDGGPDAMDKIHANIEDVLSGKQSLEEIALGATAHQQPAAGQQQPQAGQPAAGQQQQAAPVMAGGKVVGTVDDPTKVSSATTAANTMTNAQKQLNQAGFQPAGAVNESLADTMNKFASALTESGRTRSKRVLSEGINDPLPQLVMEGTLEEILQVFPHEHKMCQEGWGMDEGMFEALCDHYHREGKIPRKVWHGPMDELRKCVEECYMQDTQAIMGESSDPEDYSNYNKSEMNALGSVSSSIQVHDTPPSTPAPAPTSSASAPSTPAPAPTSTPPASGGDVNESDALMRELDEELDRVLNKENAMYESKKPSAGMSKSEKSAVAKKAQKGGDIGKPGKNFAAVAKKAAKTYGSKEAGKKVAAAAMWKNSAHQQHESIEEATDAEQIAHDRTALKRKITREKNRAGMTNAMMSAEHPTKKSGEREQAKINQTNRQLQKPEVVGEAKSRSAADNKAEKAGKKVTKDLEYDMKHKIKEAAKPDFLDMDKDGNKKETFKKAVADKKKDVDESMDQPMSKSLAKAYTSSQEHGDKQPRMSAKEKAEAKAARDARDAADMKKLHAKHDAKMKAADKKKKVKETYDFSAWDSQLTQLIEGKKPASINESARSITKRQQLNEAGLADLFAMLKNAGMQAPSAAVPPTQAPGTMEIEIDADDEMASDPQQNTAAYRDGDMGVYDGTGSPALTAQASSGDDPHSKFDDASDVPVMAMPRGMGMSQNTDGVESHVVEPVMSDEVIDHLQSGESDDSGDSTLAFIKKTMNHGESPVEVVQTQSQAAPQGGADYEVEVAEDNYGDTQQAGAAATGGSPSAMANKPAKSMNVQEEDEVDEGNAFSGAVAKAKADGIQKGEKINVDGKTYPVKEAGVPAAPGQQGQINPNNGDLAADEAGEAAQDNAGAAFDQAQAQSQPMNEEGDEKDAHDSISSILKKLEKLSQMMSDHKKKPVKEDDNMNMVANRHSELEVNEGKQECKECGGMYEGKGHKCDENLTEWANTPSQLIDEETFTSDVDFMTRGISGGLNNQKQDQTLVGSGPNRVVTQTEREDVAQSMGALLKKLGGIN